ncbi:galc [Symbiodinium pilosum]|uniref:Galc protein n=1 Tax=Symbiodinium pilosum TaxID=2952 RepID=A0A812X5B1_SYMPI|nr:galc [Symbiodinium pilosum]
MSDSQPCGCSPPESCGWTLALVEARIPSQIIAFLETDLLPNGGRTYEYALMQTESPEKMADLISSAPANVGEAESLGAKVAKSDRFVADAPPMDGMVAMNPQSGFAVTTPFAGTTTGWVDEALAENTFAFYVFPFEERLGSNHQQPLHLSTDVRLLIKLPVKDRPAAGYSSLAGSWLLPIVAFMDFTNPASSNYWTKLGGTFLRNISANASRWEVSVPAGVYFTAAVARDPLGAIATAYAPGPVVEAPIGGLSAEAASLAIDSAVASGDAGVILGMLNSLTSVEVASNDTAGQAEANAKKFEALKSASEVVQTDAGSLQKFGSVVTEVLKTSGTNGTADAASADQASDALSTVLEAALGATGVDEAAGNALLRSISAVGDSYASVQTGQAEAAAASRAARLEVMTSQLGSAALATTPVGGSATLSSVDDTGKGLEIKVQKEDISTALQNGVTAVGLQIPGDSLGSLAGQRRLQSSGCSTLAVQQTDWVQSNPFGYLNSSIGINQYVTAVSTVKVVEVKQCDSLVTIPDLARPIAMTLALPLRPQSPPEGYVFEPVCARLDPLGQALHTETDAQGWSTSVTSWFLPTSYTATTVECLATTLGGAYAGLFMPVPLATTSTTSTHTVSVTSSVTSTTPPTIAVASSDVGMVAGTSVASIAIVIVIGLCAWQAYAGNVNLKVNLPDAKASCQWMAESVKTAKIGVRPFEKQPCEPRPAWEGAEPSPQAEPAAPGKTDLKHAHRDAEDHFWDWARDLAQSASRSEDALPRGRSFGFGQSVAGTPPSIPRPHFPSLRQSDDKEEYFQSFAQELNDIIGTNMPNMAESPKTPPPPPKRSAESALTPPAPPALPSPESFGRRPSVRSSPLPPPILENAERIDLRVDRAFSDWASDFALCMPPSPTQAKGIPPPPPRRAQAPSALPLPPPRPPGMAGMDSRSSRQPTALPPIAMRENDPHEWNQFSHRPSFAQIQVASTSTNLPKPPPPPAHHQPRPFVPPTPGDNRIPLAPPPLVATPSQAPLPPPRPPPNSTEPHKPITPPVMTRGDHPRLPLVPPSANTMRPRSQLAMPLPKQQPLQPPGVPEGVEHIAMDPSSSRSEESAPTPR